MMEINKIQDKIIEEFGVFDDWMDKYNFLIELSRDIPDIDPSLKTDEYIIKGCQSRVWLNAEMESGKVVFTADSDAIIVKGIIALLIRVMSDQTPQDLMNVDLYFIDKIGLKQNLSPTRSNGLVAMIKQMKLYAIAFDARMNQ